MTTACRTCGAPFHATEGHFTWHGWAYHADCVPDEEPAPMIDGDEIERLKASLHAIARGLNDSGSTLYSDEMRSIARRTLEGEDFRPPRQVEAEVQS